MKSIYLIGINVIYKFIGVEPDVNLVMVRGIKIFKILIIIAIIVISSLDTPTSISFKFVIASNAENPIWMT